MPELLHAGALLPAAVGACCTLGSVRSRRIAAALSAIVMLLAMLDATTGILRLPTVLWTAVLIATAFVAAVAGRLASRPAPDEVGRAAHADSAPRGMRPAVEISDTLGSAAVSRHAVARHAGAMAAHGSLGLLVTAALLAAMGGAGTPAVGTVSGAGGAWGLAMAGSMHHASSASGALLTFAGIGAVAYIGLSAVLALGLPRATLRDRMAVAEVASMAASTALMLAAALLA